jgi:tetratricopeptide (TPR) repeat protein
MRSAVPTPADLERLLAAGDLAGALRGADALIAQSKRSFPGWLVRGCANLNLGRWAEADADLEMALRLAPSDPQANLLRGMVEQRLGRIDAAVDRLRKVAAMRAPQAVEAAVTLGEVFWFAHRRDDLRAMLATGGAWTADPRAALLAARVRSLAEPDDAARELEAIFRTSRNPMLRRAAGFDAVTLHDRAGRYREAFALAGEIHAATTPPFDLEGLLAPIREQLAYLDKVEADRANGASAPAPRAEKVEGVAMVVGLPRSGTTLLEQMLDRHPTIGAIGEYDGIDRVAQALASLGATPKRLAFLQRDAAAEVQRLYTDGAQRLRRADARWSFDKTLRAWRFLPAVACVLPGAVCLHVERDPRDAAISTFLSYFHPIHDGWTAALASLRRVAEAERSVSRRALRSLAIAHESLRYESLVEDPAGHAERCLARMGLAMHPDVLAPEANARAVFTLSHEQVRRPINRASIGRWKNYEFAFDASWDELARTHWEG